jgi:hypothetical protein
MPNSNPYTPEHGTTPQGTPAPDSANPYQPQSSMTPAPNCQPGAMCTTPPGQPGTMPEPKPCVPTATTACPNPGH